MVRHHGQHARGRAWIGVAVAVLLILVLLPARWTRWLDGARELATTVVAPVSHPVASLGAWLRPAVANNDLSRLEVQLEAELNQWRRQYLRVSEENQRLRALIRDLQDGTAVAPTVPVRQLSVPVIARSAAQGGRVLTVRAGSASGVVPGTVAVVDGVHLVGAVREVGARISTIVPVTDISAGLIQGVVMLDDAGGLVMGCSLNPVGDGTLRGPVGVLGGVGAGNDEDDQSLADRLQPGQIVRLLDRAGWPESAQMLVLGRLESVEQADDSRLRRVIVVRPVVAIHRASEVVLRIPLGAGTGEGDGFDSDFANDGSDG